ncbi:hypothetical protein RGQ13_05470 [Thalassotalea psychrophila]|uniref:DUF7507 domain-containing protein n=1 Tax=Thalassotalea psychrophila TaxID=3065647 RepID=A0ABY9U0C3_9GAMM|nr:hypothetical protein RGQ13_05470 [Colwelliaceae bacterium SQ149]
MKILLFKLKRLVRTTCIVLISFAALYGQSAFADSGLESLCMEDRATTTPGSKVKHLNCTANDINIASASNIEITHIDGVPLPGGPGSTDTCVSGRDVTFSAHFNVVSTASERYDIGLYFNNEGGADARQGDSDACTSYILTSAGDTMFANDLDADTCWDAEQDAEIVKAVVLTTQCIDTDDDGQLNLPNCVSWRQPGANEQCDDATDAFPGAPSKCNCDDDFNIPIFIQPDPPSITKSVTPLTGTEPGQTFTYTVVIEPDPSTGNSVFVNKIVDVLSSSTDGASATFVLNDKDGPNDIGSTISKYTLLSTGAPDGCDLVPLPYEITPISLGITCTYQIQINDSDLPDIPAPEKFENYIRATIVDENGDPVGDNTCTVPSTTTLPNPNCSNEIMVTLTNVSPTITVLKTATPDEIQETISGTTVTYNVTVTNTSPVDNDVWISAIQDAFDGAPAADISGDADCDINTMLTKTGTASCTFTYTRTLNGQPGDTISNTASVTVKDNENDTGSNTSSEDVVVTNSPGMIALTKTPNLTLVAESGENVTFTLLITNTSPVDTITLKEMTDTDFGTLFDVNGYQGTCDLYNVDLAKGASTSCQITEFLSGEPNGIDPFVDNQHYNTATVKGITEDTLYCEDFPAPLICPCTSPLLSCDEEVMASDTATVEFENEVPNVSLSVDMDLKFFLTISNGSTYESAFVDVLKVASVNVENGEGITNKFIISNNDCPEDLGTSPYELGPSGSSGPSATLNCTFTVELLDLGSANQFSVTSAGANMLISVSDDDGTTGIEHSVNVKAQLIPNP